MGKSNQQGFTIIEVMIAMVVLAVGILAVLGMHYASINGNVFSRNMTHVTFSAAGEIERIMRLEYDDTLLDGGNYSPETDGVDNDVDGTPDNDSDDGILGARVSYTVTPDNPLPGLKLIVITVFSDEGGEDTTITYSYIKAPMG